ncbi:hypothetical protein E0H93_29700 [Rhizobium leguminosarum bv. viciae]|nr:hypothetical protein [Rhizobium leguminosarum bv. viciae]TBY30722.1 hypothetical protein E0H55_20805 [Rhizobium leguminosarum bv. viciae]TBY31596.1 hypothetical protein E0H60_29910 [Rhizobium leguminosarum bv. viciae]TCA99018.1 hypothetical protein E0H93_29700 [Rhizobium leguminosarum bv. viciae]
MKSIGEISIATPGGRDFGNSRCVTGGKQGSRRSLNIVARRGGGIDCPRPSRTILPATPRPEPSSSVNADETGSDIG